MHMGHFFLSFMITLTVALELTGASFDDVRVTIIDQLPKNPRLLYFRCQDKHHDLGMQALLFHQVFSWNFRTDIFGRTLYFCHFYWGSSNQIFDVFSLNIEYYHCQNGEGHVRCFWGVRPDGFYISKDTKTWVKMHTWV
ncbi:hypothetical protein RHMOL_Rhmol12G0089900 [Rhododendron molle]|uniref:Uncharacterized protein n=3 Tax=Rhododendron molle TaxID=49168 RepID=A0ACC0LH21_RHOML|nr:hypothetical protein RHMOL_Rhmol12G0089900 [Rhododendron molle]